MQMEEPKIKWTGIAIAAGLQIANLSGLHEATRKAFKPGRLLRIYVEEVGETPTQRQMYFWKRVVVPHFNKCARQLGNEWTDDYAEDFILETCPWYDSNNQGWELNKIAKVIDWTLRYCVVEFGEPLPDQDAELWKAL